MLKLQKDVFTFFKPRVLTFVSLCMVLIACVGETEGPRKSRTDVYLTYQYDVTGTVSGFSAKQTFGFIKYNSPTTADVNLSACSVTCDTQNSITVKEEIVKTTESSDSVVFQGTETAFSLDGAKLEELRSPNSKLPILKTFEMRSSDDKHEFRLFGKLMLPPG